MFYKAIDFIKNNLKNKRMIYCLKPAKHKINIDMYRTSCYI